MPAPDPHAITINETPDARLSLLVETFMAGNRRARIERAKRILHNLARGDWSCRWCGDPVPLSRRADARFCREACRKRMARQRRLWRGE